MDWQNITGEQLLMVYLGALLCGALLLFFIYGDLDEF